MRYNTDHLVDLQDLQVVITRICRLLHDAFSNTENGRDTSKERLSCCFSMSLLVLVMFSQSKFPPHLHASVSERYVGV